MLVEGIKTDVAANNLANAATHGFKSQNHAVRSFPEMLIRRINDPVQLGDRAWDPRPIIGVLGTGSAVDELSLNMTDGPVRYTGRALDLAILGPGFMQVMTDSDELLYTRDGQLRVNQDGFLVTGEGLLVMGEAGGIPVGDGTPRIDTNGRVWSDETLVGTIILWEFEEPGALDRMGGNLLAPSVGSGEAFVAAQSEIRPEHLELSNVNVVNEMVNLITIQRAYEANQRMIQAQDETLGRLINDLPNLA